MCWIDAEAPESASAPLSRLPLDEPPLEELDEPPLDELDEPPLEELDEPPLDELLLDEPPLVESRPPESFPPAGGLEPPEEHPHTPPQTTAADDRSKSPVRIFMGRQPPRPPISCNDARPVTRVRTVRAIGDRTATTKAAEIG
jgi:hypothetical protein